MTAEKINKLLLFRDGKLVQSCGEYETIPLDLEVGDVVSDGWMFFGWDGEKQKLLPIDHPGREAMLAQIPDDVNRGGWLLARAFGGTQ